MEFDGTCIYQELQDNLLVATSVIPNTNEAFVPSRYSNTQGHVDVY